MLAILFHFHIIRMSSSMEPFKAKDPTPFFLSHPPLPSHVSIACFSHLPGRQSCMDSAKEKPQGQGALASWFYPFFSSLFLFLSDNVLPPQPASSLTTAWAQQHHWSLCCLVTWPQSSSPGVTAWLEVQWRLGVIWVELIVLFSLLFNHAPPFPN